MQLQREKNPICSMKKLASKRAVMSHIDLSLRQRWPNSRQPLFTLLPGSGFRCSSTRPVTGAKHHPLLADPTCSEAPAAATSLCVRKYRPVLVPSRGAMRLTAGSRLCSANHIFTPTGDRRLVIEAAMDRRYDRVGRLRTDLRDPDPRISSGHAVARRQPTTCRRLPNPASVMTERNKSLLPRRIGIAAMVATVLLAVLAVPEREPPIAPAPERGQPFTWDRDAYWSDLQARFEASTQGSCAKVDEATTHALDGVATRIAGLRTTSVEPDAALLDSLEHRFFEAGALVARCPAALPVYARLQSQLRDAIKDQSRGWDMASSPARSRIYRALYGSRGALEEVLLHHPGQVPDVLFGRTEPSATPHALIEGVTVHSGDILVSRGGYPTSALIARGSDFPGNFSHVALVHVDSASGAVSVIEAHIERGVAISSGEEYLRDKKRRILVLRPRSDLPALIADPMRPHRAASRMLARARSERIPYDFAMDYSDPSRLFCSEVASAAYRDEGITLWTGLSTISAPGLRRWLSSFGVRHFETQEPSDLEYDPQLVVVAEWRDPESLAADHIDNAVIDAMLEGAEAGDELTYDWYRLPAARAAKAYSWLLNRFGGVGPVPEGMASRSALRNQSFTVRQREIAADVATRAEAWHREHGYPAPYWTLLELARRVVGELSTADVGTPPPGRTRASSR